MTDITDVPFSDIIDFLSKNNVKISNDKNINYDNAMNLMKKSAKYYPKTQKTLKMSSR